VPNSINHCWKRVFVLRKLVYWTTHVFPSETKVILRHAIFLKFVSVVSTTTNEKKGPLTVSPKFLRKFSSTSQVCSYFHCTLKVFAQENLNFAPQCAILGGSLPPSSSSRLSVSKICCLSFSGERTEQINSFANRCCSSANQVRIVEQKSTNSSELETSTSRTAHNLCVWKAGLDHNMTIVHAVYSRKTRRYRSLISSTVAAHLHFKKRVIVQTVEANRSQLVNTMTSWVFRLSHGNVTSSQTRSVHNDSTRAASYRATDVFNHFAA